MEDSKMRKFIILLFSSMMSAASAQTSLDIVKEINKSAYKSLTEPKQEIDMSKERAESDKMEKEFYDKFSNSLKSYKSEMEKSKAEIDAQNKITELNMKISDLEYGIKRRDEQLKEYELDAFRAKLRYHILSKYVVLLYNNITDIDKYFNEAEMKILQEICVELDNI